MEKIRLSKNFSLAEMVATSFPAFQKPPTTQEIANLAYLCAAVLQPLRNSLGEPIIITSGYRSPSLNKYVGGVANSRQLNGFAADIRVKTEAHARRMYEILKKNHCVDSCLVERKGATRWLHVQTSYNPRGLFNFNYNV